MESFWLDNLKFLDMTPVYGELGLCNHGQGIVKKLNEIK